jgi:hypothetical protein
MRTLKSFLLCLSVAAAVLVVTHGVNAQYTDRMGVGWNNAMSASASTMIWNSIFYGPKGALNGTKRPSTTANPASQPKKPVKPINPNAVKFKPTGTYIKTRELADALASTPAEGEQYQKIMNALLDSFGQRAQKAGFPNDIATALAYFLGENIRIYRGIPDLSNQQYIDLRNTIANALTTSGAVDNMTDRQKQEFYETLVAYTGLTQFGYEQGVQSQNDAVIKGYQKVAGQNLQSLTKMSPNTINYGPDGLSASSGGSF